jgi:MFS transporter, PAT family, beta-lactamase induction signal transducer AmpG
VAGMLEFHYADNAKAWSITMILVAVLMLALAAANYVASPRTELSPAAQGENRQNFFTIIASFFQKKKIWVAVGFILTYRLGEAQLVKMASPFLLDTSDKGGLALTTSQVGTIYGAIGVVALVIGGILGGIAISRHGLGRWMLPMMLALNLPNLLYVGLAWVQPTHLWVATGVVFLEQFGYGFGFAAYLMYLIYVADGPTKTSHYALATGLMALGMMLPGMLSGFIQEHLGYTQFFIWVVVSALPAFVLLRHLDFPAEFGKKKE